MTPRHPPKLYKKKGYHYAVFYDPARTPTRKWVALHTEKQRVARRLFTKMEDEYLEGISDPWRESDPRRKTLAGAIRLYVDDRTHPWRERTRQDRRAVLGRFERSLPPGTLLDHVRDEDARAFLYRDPMEEAAYVQDERGEKLQPSTVATYYARLYAFFSWCVDHGYLRTSPMREIKRPPPGRKPPEYLAPDQYLQLLERIRQDQRQKSLLGQLNPKRPNELLWLLDVFSALLYTAMRPEELQRLRWRDVNLATGRIFVRNTSRGKTKTETEGVVPIVNELGKLLRRLEGERPNEDPNAAVFLSPDRSKGPRPFSLNTASKRFRQYREELGFPRELHLRSLRKTTGVWLISKGVSLKVVQKIYRHKRIETTADIYVDVFPDVVVAEMQRAFDESLK